MRAFKRSSVPFLVTIAERAMAPEVESLVCGGSGGDGGGRRRPSWVAMRALIVSGLAAVTVLAVCSEGGVLGAMGMMRGGEGGAGVGGGVVLYMSGEEADARNLNHARVWKSSRETEEQGWPKVPGKFRVPPFNNAPDR